MKTRIKTIELNDGNKTYTCQYQARNWLAILFCFLTVIFIPYGIVILLWTYRDFIGGECDTLSDAEQFINIKLDFYRREKAKKHLRKVKSTTYTKYP